MKDAHAPPIDVSFIIAGAVAYPGACFIGLKLRFKNFKIRTQLNDEAPFSHLRTIHLITSGVCKVLKIQDQFKCQQFRRRDQ